jgi:D-serine deaminase-like pyridoxal phosphate-dependent protein
MSVGDTPSLSVAGDLAGADEARPGNFVFYDGQQLEIGACQPTDIATAVACPIVASYPARGQVVLYGGAVHLSKDVARLPDGRAVFGFATSLGPDGWGELSTDNVVASVSQEHGVVQLAAPLLEQLQPGDLLAVVPAHICLTVNLLRQYLTLDGEVLEATGGA